MTVQDLMEQLEGLDPFTEVRFASQPKWPFEYSIDGLHIPEQDDESDDDESNPVVYLIEGNQIGYLPEDITSAIGW